MGQKPSEPDVIKKQVLESDTENEIEEEQSDNKDFKKKISQLTNEYMRECQSKIKNLNYNDENHEIMTVSVENNSEVILCALTDTIDRLHKIYEGRSLITLECIRFQENYDDGFREYYHECIQYGIFINRGRMIEKDEV